MAWVLSRKDVGIQAARTGALRTETRGVPCDHRAVLLRVKLRHSGDRDSTRDRIAMQRKLGNIRGGKTIAHNSFPGLERPHGGDAMCARAIREV